MVTGVPAFHLLRALMGAGDLPDLGPILERPAWHAEASCRGMGTTLFFPERGVRPDAAKAVCARCPVQQQCYDATDAETQGVWAGTSAADRRQARTAAA